MKFFNAIKKIKHLAQATHDPLRKHELKQLETLVSLQKQLGEKKVSSKTEKRIEQMTKNKFSAGASEKFRDKINKFFH